MKLLVDSFWLQLSSFLMQNFKSVPRRGVGCHLTFCIIEVDAAFTKFHCVRLHRNEQ